MILFPKNQFLRLRYPVALTIAVTTVVVFSFIVLGQITRTPLSSLTRDLPVLTNSSIYLGLMSRLGEMLWAGTTAVCLVGGILLYRPGRRSAIFLIASGLFSFLLTLDDVLMLHEHLLPETFRIPENAIYASYLALMTSYLVYFRHMILESDYLLLFASCLFFAASMSLDVLIELNELGTFIEDSFKFVGIVFWLLYYTRTTLHLTHAAMMQTPID